LNELQRYAARGNIDSGVLASLNSTKIDDLVEFIRTKNYTQCRKWVAENLDSPTVLFREFYDSSVKLVNSNMIPALVVLIGKYQYNSCFVADQEVNMMAFIAECMLEGCFEQ